MPKIKKWAWRLGLLAIVGIVMVVVNYYWVEKKTAPYIYPEVGELPTHKVGLVLGTSKYLSTGQKNLFYQYRIQAAWELFEAGKVEHLLLSGDNGTPEYNEPAMMQADLIAKGVPAERIHLDYAGFRTLDSVVRARAIFGQHQLVCVSQPFHVARAIYIGQRKGIEMVGYPARAVAAEYGRSVMFREYLARVKMQLDLLFGKQPRFYGPPVEIG